MTLPLSAVVNVTVPVMNATVQVWKSLFVSDEPHTRATPCGEVHLHHVAPALCRPADLAWDVDDVSLHAA